jgi:hypothetical protein
MLASQSYHDPGKGYRHAEGLVPDQQAEQAGRVRLLPRSVLPLVAGAPEHAPHPRAGPSCTGASVYDGVPIRGSALQRS